METETAILDALRSSERQEKNRAEFEIFHRYQPQVRAMLSKVVGSDAGLDDAVQEAFIDIFRGLPRFEGRSGLGTWIYRVAMRRGWKCAARQKARWRKEVGSEVSVEHASGSAPGGDLQTREMARRLENALGQLSFEHRSIMALSGLEGLTTAEVAATSGFLSGRFTQGSPGRGKN